MSIEMAGVFILGGVAGGFLLHMAIQAYQAWKLKKMAAELEKELMNFYKDFNNISKKYRTKNKINVNQDIH